MKTKYHYNVRFTLNGEPPRTIVYLDDCVAGAYAKCLRRFPEAKLLGALVRGCYMEAKILRVGVTTYEAPSTVRIVAEPGPPEEQTVFPFLTEISSSKKQNGAAA